MEILVDHLTRMKAGYICATGLDGSGRHIRPVTGGRLPATLLVEAGGPLAVGSIVDLGKVEAVGAAPEVEDHRFEPDHVQVVRVESAWGVWGRLERDAELSLTDNFGHDLHKTGLSAVVPPGAGRASLGTLSPGYRPKLEVNAEGRLRCRLVDVGLGALDLSVTDVRLYRLPSWGLDERRIDEATADLEAGRGVLLSVGLTREFRGSHWLQVNNLHFEPKDSPASAPPKAYTVESVRERYPNAYKARTDAEEAELERIHRAGTSPIAIAKAMGRNTGAIKSRLARLELD